ncbi:ABC-2 type transporter [compost metagenome]
MNMLIGMVMLVVGLLIFGHGLHMEMLWVLLTFPALAILVAGVSLCLSSLGVYFRDLAQLIGLLTTLWMYATPILYAEEMVPDYFLPILRSNPLTHLVNFNRDALFWGVTPNLMFLVWFYVVAAIVFIAGFYIFGKLKRGFADVL